MLTTIKIMVLGMMLFAAYQDIRHKEVNLSSILVCVILSAISVGMDVYRGESVVPAVIALLPGMAFLLLSFVTRGAVGIGDGLMLMGIGPAFGMDHTVLGLFIGLGLSCVVSIILLVSRKGNSKSQLPFVPFMALGMGVMMFA